MTAREVKEIKAWSYQQRTARKYHTCRICKEEIGPGTKYVDIAISDNVTPSSEKLTHQAEHLDCNMPWYLPGEKTPISALARLRVPINAQGTSPKVRFELASSGDSGPAQWQSPTYLQLALELASLNTRAEAITAINSMFAILTERIMQAQGSKYETRKLENDMLILQAGLDRKLDLSRFEKKQTDLE